MVTVHALAATIARPELEDLFFDAECFPASYGKARIVEDADKILDKALDRAYKLRSQELDFDPPCVIGATSLVGQTSPNHFGEAL